MKFKKEEDKELLYACHPILLGILFDLNLYAYLNHGITLEVTATVTSKSEDSRLNRSSNAHNLRRAVDIRTKNIKPSIVNDLIDYINNKPEFKRFHYASHTGRKRLAYYHGRKNIDEHIHLAIHARYSLPPLFEN